MSTDYHTDTILEMRDLYVGYYKDLNILQGLDIKVQRNRITAVLGANGVGKSTALRAAPAGKRSCNSARVKSSGRPSISAVTDSSVSS